MTKEQELKQLMKELEGKDKADSNQLNRLYNLNNHFFPLLKEYCKSCPSITSKVYKRLQKLNETL